MKHSYVLAGLLFAVVCTPSAALEGRIWKSPTCGCCKSWVTYMQQNGFELSVTEANPRELDAIKSQSGIPKAAASCHTAKIGGYAIEGHVPASAVTQLLQEKPDAIGLAVPGMPANSPGMETDRPGEAYDVLLVNKDGSTRVFLHVPATPAR